MHQKNRYGLFIRTIGMAHAQAKLTLAILAYNFGRLIFHERRAATGYVRLKSLERAQEHSKSIESMPASPINWPRSTHGPLNGSSRRRNHGCCGCPEGVYVAPVFSVLAFQV